MRRLALATLTVLVLLAAAPHAAVNKIEAAPSLAPLSPDALRVSGPTQRALLVEGEFGALVIADSPDLSPRAEITVEAWVKRDDRPGCATIVGKNRARSYWFGLCDGKLRFYSGNGAFADGSAIIPVGRWTHVAVSFDGQMRRFYVNGALDRAAPENASPLGVSTSDLRIGADQTAGAFFLGRIDEVRIWNVVRSDTQIRTGRLEPAVRSTGLVAAWALDGNGDDLLGENSADTDPAGTFTFDGALPRNITLPVVTNAITMDGKCEGWEYGASERVALDMKNSGTVHIHLTTTDLHVCFEDMPRGNQTTGRVSVYLDRDTGRTNNAQLGDYRFNISFRGTLTVDEADGVGGWKELRPIPGNWTAARNTTTGTEFWSAELQISRSYIFPQSDPDKDPTVGIMVSQTGVDANEERGWPVAAEPLRPITWSEALLGEDGGELPRFHFTGIVRLEQEEDDPRPGRGIANAVVQLLAWDDEKDILSLEDVDTTDGGGAYELDWQGKDPDAFVIKVVDSRGTISMQAIPGSGGEARGANVVLYEIANNRPPVNLEFAGTEFVDRASPADRPLLNQHYLIIYDAPVTEDDLWPIINAKAGQGFRVIPMSVRDLTRTVPGRDAGEKVQKFLADYWTAVEPEPVYALIVGRGDKVPVRDVGWLDTVSEPGDPEYYPRWPTDWYYADVDSGWDANGNGFYGEYLGCAPGETYIDKDGDVADCPEAGSLSREGPFGSLRGGEDDYLAEIAIGRIAVNEAGEVRRALQASVNAERTGGEAKRRALIAAGMWSWTGLSWSEASRRSVPGGSPEADPWLIAPWSGGPPLGVDAGGPLERLVKPILAPFMGTITTLYETQNPFDDPSLNPSGLTPTAPLSRQAFDQHWPSHGLVFLAGNGSREGLMAAHWVNDWNFDFVINQPDRPEACRGAAVSAEQVGPPCWELLPENVADNRLTAPTGPAPVVFANAGSTGNVAWELDGADAAGNILGMTTGPASVAGDLLGRGAVAAWVGSYTGFTPQSADAMQLAFAREMVSGQRLGDAVWAAQRERAETAPSDLRSYGMQLFGDPAMTYWGNTPDTRGPWPQAEGDWGASGRSSYSGPDTGQVDWTGRDGAPSSAASIAGDGTIFIAGRAAILRYSPAGARLDQAALPGAPPGADVTFAPAVTTDGVTLVAGSNLYRFDGDLNLTAQVRLPESATGAVRVAPDGTSWVPTDNGMVRVSGSGVVTIVGDAAVRGGPVFLPNGEVVWSEEGGVLARYKRDLRTGVVELIHDDVARTGELTAPSADADGTVYVGTTSGRIHALPVEDRGWDRDLGAPITARPIIGDDGTLYVVAGNSVFALDGGGGAEVWRSTVSLPVSAAPVVDGSQLFLTGGRNVFALDRATGGSNWILELDSTVDARGTPVIGADRTMYVLLRDNSLVAVREAGWLAAPSNVTATATGSDVTVAWADTTTNESGFRVELCTVERRCGAAETAGPNATSLRLRNVELAPGAPFYVRVQALGPVGAQRVELWPRGTLFTAEPFAEATRDSDFAVSDLASLSPEAVLSPTSLAARATGADKITLTWSYSGDAGQLGGFTVGRSTVQAGPFSNIAFVSPSATEFVDEDLNPDTDYFYELRAVNELGPSSAADSTATTWRRTITLPTDLQLSPTETGVRVAWRSTAPAIEEWLIERLDPGEAKYHVVGRIDGPGRSFQDNIYLIDGTYGYRVRAIGKENESGMIVGQVRIVRNVITGEESSVFLPSASTRH